MHARLAIIYQSVVATGQLQLQLLSANIVNDVDTKRLGTVPTAAGMIARLAYARVRSAGIELAQQLLDLRELGMLFYGAASSETLGDALQRMARYSSTVNEGLSLKCLAGEEIRFVYQYVGVVRYLDRHQIEFFMTLLIRLCRHLTGLRLAPSRARIMHRRSSPAGSELAAYFGGKISFGASADELIFVGNVKDIKVTSADPYLNELLVANCEQALSHRCANKRCARRR